MENDLYWNPLDDDGDALRLAVKCKLDLFLHELGALVNDGNGLGIELEERLAGDPYAATRRAIVRAAAEIGREMP